MNDPTAHPTPRLRIQPAGWVVDVAAGDSLLEAAQRAGIRLVRSCRNGTCRRCLCRLLEGEVGYRVEWPGLSREERSDGWILPCVALAQRDVSIDAPSALRETG